MLVANKGRVLIKAEIIEEKQLASGLWITKAAREQQLGELRKGSIVKAENFKEGTIVWFSQYSAERIPEEDNLLIIAEDDIMCYEE